MSWFGLELENTTSQSNVQDLLDQARWPQPKISGAVWPSYLSWGLIGHSLQGQNRVWCADSCETQCPYLLVSCPLFEANFLLGMKLPTRETLLSDTFTINQDFSNSSGKEPPT